jgi:UDP-N-acetylenolpyruvoylglucosamine reductase
MNYDQLLRVIEKKYPNRVKRNEPMASHTTFKIGGPADLFIQASTTQELIDCIRETRKFQLPLFIIGGGSNILVADKGIRGVVIKNATNTITTKAIKGEISHGIREGRVYIEADSGVAFNRLVRYTIDEGFSGIEMHLGLPGTVGGAVYQNSKWTKPVGYVGDVVYQAEILTPKGELITVPSQYFQFGYDQSSIQETKDIVITVTFSFKRDTKERLWDIADASIEYRKVTQPQGVFTPGCIFKNISKSLSIAKSLPDYTTSAGFLIDHSGLKGEKVGDAQISTVHANFIINTGHACASDVIQLIDRAKEQVKRQFGIELEEEIERIGEF